MIDYQKMLIIAIEKTKLLPIETEFEVKDLFVGVVNWQKELQQGEKTKLGSLYSNAFDCGNITNIERVPIKRGKPNRYRKTK